VSLRGSLARWTAPGGWSLKRPEWPRSFRIFLPSSILHLPSSPYPLCYLANSYPCHPALSVVKSWFPIPVTSCSFVVSVRSSVFYVECSMFVFPRPPPFPLLPHVKSLSYPCHPALSVVKKLFFHSCHFLRIRGKRPAFDVHLFTGLFCVFCALSRPSFSPPSSIPSVTSCNIPVWVCGENGLLQALPRNRLRRRMRGGFWGGARTINRSHLRRCQDRCVSGFRCSFGHLKRGAVSVLSVTSCEIPVLSVSSGSIRGLRPFPQFLIFHFKF
jgi:hypothetical protein